MAWIELHQSLPHNKKTMRLKKYLKIKTPQAVGHLCLLWLWAIDNAPDGDLSEFDDYDIADVCEYPTNKSKAFYEALVDSGFIDNDKRLHDWDEYIGKLIITREYKREQDRVRQQRKRDKDKLKCDSNAIVTHDENVSRSITPPYPTPPYPTVPLDSGGGGDAQAHEHESESEELTELAAVWEQEDTETEIQNLSPEAKKNFYITVSALWKTRFDREIIKSERIRIYELMRSIRYFDGAFHPLEMTKDDVYLLSEAINAAIDANKTNIAYISGVYKKYRERGIKTESDYWDFEYNRNNKK